MAVFLTGACVLIIGVVDTRILLPYYGNTIFIVSSIMGVVLVTLSTGYYFGGKIADKNPTLSGLSFIIFLASVFIGLTTLIKDPLLIAFESGLADIKINLILSSLILFLPTSLLLGMVSPYAAKLKIDDLSNSGSTIGNLYALSTAGSIFGTFISGFYLIPKFGTNKLLIMLAITLVIISLSFTTKFLKIKAVVLVLATLGWTVTHQLQLLAAENGFVDIDTAYSRIWIYDNSDQKTGQTTRTLAINPWD